jgi:hypothetical protein
MNADELQIMAARAKDFLAVRRRYTRLRDRANPYFVDVNDAYVRMSRSAASTVLPLDVLRLVAEVERLQQVTQQLIASQPESRESLPGEPRE